MALIKENLVRIREKVFETCMKTGRNPEEVKLVAVTKTLPPEVIEEAHNYGIDIVGENKVQEMVDKLEYLKNLSLEWHFIGHLQTNKVKYLVDRVELIHSVDRLKLAKEINQEWAKKDKQINVLIQANISGEASKFGINEEETMSLVKDISGLCNINITGLMTMAPYTETPEEVRHVFSGLRLLAERIRQENIPGVKMQELSMGMTNDYEVAVEEGATLIRIGSGIFGERHYR
ncbi:MAG: YggS family pyridoxal phosphate-dependent enzyme [Clostridia bacterium]|jgi:pyridoxal phosphate enzyme (YggS family)|nr:YggS family pyridoxal phosphate-dependent enzyme [Clostridia bacterium]